MARDIVEIFHNFSKKDRKLFNRINRLILFADLTFIMHAFSHQPFVRALYILF